MTEVKIKSNKEHYEVYMDRNFICSCDNLQEAKEEIDLLRKENKNGVNIK